MFSACWFAPHIFSFFHQIHFRYTCCIHIWPKKLGWAKLVKSVILDRSLLVGNQSKLRGIRALDWNSKQSRYIGKTVQEHCTNKMHPNKLNCINCNSLIGGGQAEGQLEGFQRGQCIVSQNCRNPGMRWDGPDTDDDPGHAQYLTATICVPAGHTCKVPRSLGSQFWRWLFQGPRKPGGSHFYLLSISAHFLNWPGNPQFVGWEAGEEIDKTLSCVQLGEVAGDPCLLPHMIVGMHWILNCIKDWSCKKFDSCLAICAPHF